MKVKFLPSGEEHEIEFNETVLHLAQRVGLHIQSVCKGIPSCAECRVQIAEGEHHVLPPSKKELDLIGTAHYVDRSRLSCQLRCFGDLEIDLKEQIEKEKRAQQKPKDRLSRRDGETSRAVLGGILDNVVAEDAVSPELIDQKQIEVVAVEAFKGDPHLDKRDSFYGDFYTGKNKNNNQDNNKRSGGGGKNNNPNRQNQNDKQSQGQNKRNRHQNRSQNAQASTTNADGKPQQNQNAQRNQNNPNRKNNQRRGNNQGSRQGSQNRNAQTSSGSGTESKVAIQAKPDFKNGNQG